MQSSAWVVTRFLNVESNDPCYSMVCAGQLTFFLSTRSVTNHLVSNLRRQQMIARRPQRCGKPQTAASSRWRGCISRSSTRPIREWVFRARVCFNMCTADIGHSRESRRVRDDTTSSTPIAFFNNAHYQQLLSANMLDDILACQHVGWATCRRRRRRRWLHYPLEMASMI